MDADVDLEILYRKASEILGVPKKRVREVYRLYWMKIKEYMESLPLKKSGDLEDVRQKVNVNIQHVGKFWIDGDDFTRLSKYFKNGKYETEDGEACVQQDSRNSGEIQGSAEDSRD